MKLRLTKYGVDHEDGRALIEPDPSDKPGELEFIVRAVNEYEETQEKLVRYEREIKILLDNLDEIKPQRLALLEAAKRAEFLIQQLEKKGDDFLVLKGLREAIAQAEGGK